MIPSDKFDRLKAPGTIPPRHLALDLLRGLAAIGVMVYHWLDWRQGINVQSLGTFGVYMFFVLSAVAMTIAYGHVFTETITRPALADFFRNRAARLLPLLCGATLAMLVLNLMGQGASFTAAMLDEALLTGSGLMALAPPGYVSTVGGGWSLGIELAFYAIAPIAILVSRHFRAVHWWCLLGTLVIAQHTFIFSIAGIADPARHWQLYTMPITFAPFFAAGFLIVRLGGERSRGMLAPMAICFIGMAGISLIYSGNLQRSNGAFLVASLLCVLTVYFGYRSTLPSWLEAAARSLGDMSYALYLLHLIMFNVNSIIMSQLGLNPRVSILLDLVGSPIAAFACFYWFERPLRDRFRSRRAKEYVATLP